MAIVDKDFSLLALRTAIGSRMGESMAWNLNQKEMSQ
jgi:hypothetical protein